MQAASWSLKGKVLLCVDLILVRELWYHRKSARQNTLGGEIVRPCASFRQAHGEPVKWIDEWDGAAETPSLTMAASRTRELENIASWERSHLSR